MTPADHKSTAPESYLWGKERARRGEHSHASADHKSTAPESYLWGKDCERERRGEHSHARHVAVRAERGALVERAPARVVLPLVFKHLWRHVARVIKGDQKGDQGSAYPLFLSTSGAT
jgi:hypothetical protein